MRDKDEQTTSFLYCYHWLNCRRRIVSFYATATEKADNDMAPLQQKLVVVSNKREKPINDRRSRQQEVTPAGTSIRYEAASNRKAEEWSRRFASTPSSTTP